jgi:DNA-binding transcriptional ArsR family regulator
MARQSVSKHLAILTGANLVTTVWRGERRSKVTFDIEPVGEMVKLTVIHDDFDAGSAVLPGISEGWPRILSDLKTLLEAGDTLPVR